MATRLTLAALGLLFMLAVGLNKPAIVALPLALIVPGFFVWAGYRSFGWRGVAINLTGFVALGALMTLMLGTDSPH